jgi:hypothetical protein
MASIPGTPKWADTVYQFSTEDPVEGGPTGIDNLPLSQLADRTAYLKQITDGLQIVSTVYSTVAAAQSAINAGQIPLNAVFNVMGTTDDSFFDQYQNVGGVARPTGRSYPTSTLVNSINSVVQVGYQQATSVAGTENLIQITIPRFFANGTPVFFTAKLTNAGPTTIEVTNAAGNTFSATIFKEGNSPLSAGDIAANQPVLMIYRGVPINNWILVASGGVATTLANRISKLESSAIYPLTSQGGVGDAYTASCVTDGSALFSQSRIVSMTVPTTSTTAAPTLAINGGAARPIRAPNGGSLNPGDLVAGYVHMYYWHLASSQWRLLFYPADRGRYLTQYQKATVTSTAASPNIISLTINGFLGDGTQLTFEPLANNTGATQLVITDLSGNVQTRNLLKGANTPLVGNELQAHKIAVVQWRGAPQNNFKLVLAGDVTTDIANLNTSITNLKTIISDPLATLTKAMIESPFGIITFDAGVKTVVKNRLIMTSLGSSVGGGAGAGAEYAPNALLIASLKKYMANYGEFEFIDDNQCIPTQSWQQFPAQLNNSPYDHSDILLIVGGMNDAPVGNFNMGRTFPQQKPILDSLIKQGQARGAIVIVCTTPHHNVEMPQTAPTIPAGNPLMWPVRTFSMLSEYSFNAENRTINSGYFASEGYGGNILRPGYSLRVDSGANFGVYTIESISADRTTITVVEPIPSTSRYGTTVRHYRLETIMEEVLYPPPSQSVVTKDWTGNGVPVAGDVRFEMQNNFMQVSARENGAIIADCGWSFFRYGVEVVGYSGVYDVPKGNFNHPNAYGYQVGYGKPLDDVARYLSDMAFQTRVFGRS